MANSQAIVVTCSWVWRLRVLSELVKGLVNATELSEITYHLVSCAAVSEGVWIQSRNLVPRMPLHLTVYWHVASLHLSTESIGIAKAAGKSIMVLSRRMGVEVVSWCRSKDEVERFLVPGEVKESDNYIGLQSLLVLELGCCWSC